MAANLALNIVSFNLRGIHSGIATLNELCGDFSTVAVQEH